MVAWMWLGRRATSLEVEKLAAYCEPHGVVWEPHFDVPKVNTGKIEEMLWQPDDILNEWYWYYATLAFKERGGPHWEKWNAQLKDVMISHQRRRGDDAGSWDCEGAWGRAGGRVYTTAFGAMTLEAYYQYDR